MLNSLSHPCAHELVLSRYMSGSRSRMNLECFPSKGSCVDGFVPSWPHYWGGMDTLGGGESLRVCHGRECAELMSFFLLSLPPECSALKSFPAMNFSLTKYRSNQGRSPWTITTDTASQCESFLLSVTARGYSAPEMELLNHKIPLY